MLLRQFVSDPPLMSFVSVPVNCENMFTNDPIAPLSPSGRKLNDVVPFFLQLGQNFLRCADCRRARIGRRVCAAEDFYIIVGAFHILRQNQTRTRHLLPRGIRS